MYQNPDEGGATPRGVQQQVTPKLQPLNERSRLSNGEVGCLGNCAQFEDRVPCKDLADAGLSLGPPCMLK